MQWWEVRPDGQVGRLASAPTPSSAKDVAVAPLDPIARSLGQHPLAAALEDGWPLVDGSALVARDGALARVRLLDGAVVETVANAFPLKSARCHPLSLARAGDAFGFVCGEPRGTTALYRWDPAQARLMELHAFDRPREVLSFGNGSLAARGSCTTADLGEAKVGEQAWCIIEANGAERELHLHGEDVDGARLVVLSDGREALVRPPSGGDLSTARLSLTAGNHATHIPLSMPSLSADVARVLRLGVWMDGFEERRPGVVAGWIDGAGSVVGIEIATDGVTRVGQYIRDPGAVIVSGRWGFGWTASRRGFETTDGGMTWRQEDELPDSVASASGVRERACGPIGCVTGGWLRVGLGCPCLGDAPGATSLLETSVSRHGPARLRL